MTPGREDSTVGVEAVLDNVRPLAMAMLGPEWALGRLKVVEDQWAADVARIDELEGLLADMDLNVGTLKAENTRLRADLARAGLALDEMTRKEPS